MHQLWNFATEMPLFWVLTTAALKDLSQKFQPQEDWWPEAGVVRAADGGRDDDGGRRASIPGRPFRGLVHLHRDRHQGPARAHQIQSYEGLADNDAPASV